MNEVVKQIDETVPKKELPDFDLTSAQELKDLILPPLIWLIESLLCIGLVLVVGAPKVGKSWLMLAIALAVASGKEIFGFEVHASSVVFFALEDSLRRLKARMRLLGIDEWPENLQFITELPCPQELFLNCLEKYLTENPDTKLVIIDTLQRVKGQGGYGNAYEIDTEALVPFHGLAKRFNVCLLLVHHTRKSNAADPYDKISGSQGLMATADTVMMVESFRGKVDRVLRLTGRDVEEKDYAMEFTRGVWTLLGEVSDVTMSNERKQILEFVNNSSCAVGPKDVSDGTELSYESVKNMMPKMVKDGTIEREGRGKYVSRTFQQPHIPTTVKPGDLMTSEED